MKDKIAIINGYGNCCPECGSPKITIHEQRNLYIDRNLPNRKPFVMKGGKIRYMSNHDKVKLFDCADMSAGSGCCSYECWKCGWTSEMYTE